MGRASDSRKGFQSKEGGAPGKQDGTSGSGNPHCSDRVDVETSRMRFLEAASAKISKAIENLFKL